MTRFVMLALDGLRPDMVTPALTPHLCALAAAGTRFANARSVFPSETRVATPSLITGCRPGGHGMVANTLFDAAAAPDRLLRTKLVADVAAMAQGRETPLQRPSLAERLAPHGRSFALVSAGTAGAARLLHPAAERLGAFRWNVEDEDGATAAEVRAALGATPPHGMPNTARVEFAGRVLLEHVLPHHAPDVALLWLSEPDVAFHWAGLGAAETLAALRAADAVLGRVMDWRDAQPDAAEIGIIVLSDHGHVTGTRKLSLRDELVKAGFRAGTGMGPDVDVVVAPAAAPGLWLRDPALAPQIAEFLARQDWAGPLLARDPGILPAGHAFPLAALGSAHARSADLVATFAGTETADAWGLPGTAPFDAPDVPEGGGMHGGLHRAELATVLVMQGGPFRRRAVAEEPADLTDIVPTLLHALGLPGEGMEGRPLRAAFDAALDAPPLPLVLPLRGGFALEAMRATPDGRLYPTALRRA
ncbi:alkaline phosphatase family protein [Roseococcus sp. SDR]|uniref:alkaline phosphatase family protein n=1 Tax=Roseococcus sp. SDR TaxID=2835532 RepID=UPI001BCF9618|nr:alkaline phosphatase family protein [Roseococcus sp. SDR]MBS7792291.1 alkaline phosphatase family protein [Roseococcus sp. SDR]MBV1847605.1 alkaline phosphatase family protein [Roseococcus sp. SDR]